MGIIVSVPVLAFAAMGIEAVVSGRHERQLRAAGAVDPPGDVYRVMQILYPGAFVVMMAEAAMHPPALGPVTIAGLVVFALAKALKYWAIATLGSRWSFRVLVPPGSTRILTGPYRWISHPNYLAVAGELGGFALAMHARISGPIAVAAFSVVMWRRIQIEEKALGGE